MLNRQDSAPKPGPETEIRRVPAAITVSCIVLSEKISGFWTHWAVDHSVPCQGKKETCPAHRSGYPLRWKGYLYVLDLRSNEEYFLELTPIAAKALEAVLGTSISWRGTRMEIRRGNGQKARLSVSVQEIGGQRPTGHLSAAKDVTQTLVALWGIDDDPQLAILAS